MRHVLTLLLALWVAALFPVAAAQAVRRDHLTIELVAESARVAPGGKVLAGLRLQHDPHWHTYWINPGDSGLPTKIAWTLPAGVTAGAIQWPVPHRLSAGPLTNFGYDDELLLPVEITVSADVAPGTVLPLKAKADWLVCEVECIPGDAELTLQLEVSLQPAAPSPWSALFAHTRTQLPQAMPGASAEVTADGGDYVITVKGEPGALARGAFELFPVQAQVLENARGTAQALGDGLVQVRTPRSEYFTQLPQPLDLVFAVGEGEARRSYHVAATASGVAASTTAGTAGGNPAASRGPTAPAQAPVGLLTALLLALAGGALLNLMPCVFPVLALKALSLAEGAHDRAAARRDGVAYLAGVLAAFLALAGVLIALRAGGEALGWGFQLQVPWVVAGLALLMVAVGLSLSGVFHIGGRFMGAGQSLASQGGARGAFFTGLLAVVVASPCTAPFMGPALGFAATQSAVAALAVFAMLGIGLALPLVLLAFVPALAKVLPRPGAWMDTLKQVLAFPMYLTALWLFWVLGQQTGVDGMTRALFAAIALGFGLWLLGRAAAPGNGARVLRAASVAAALAVSVYAIATLPEDAPATTASIADRNYEPFSPQRLDTLRSANRPVLVNMTAAWCITCLANERVALATDSVRSAMRQLDVAYLKGDWTHRDAAITAYLAQFGRNGVPLYVLYPPGGGEPRVLPQVLTPGLVVEALQHLGSPTTLADAHPP